VEAIAEAEGQWNAALLASSEQTGDCNLGLSQGPVYYAPGDCTLPVSGGGCNSPIAISLGGEEIINNISSSEDGVPYDLKGDGHPLWYAWQKRGDHQIGWLALTDENGRVPNGKYLFGKWRNRMRWTVLRVISTCSRASSTCSLRAPQSG
jgi:hypothetical protein